MPKGTKEGSIEEINLVKKLNSDKESNLWEFMGLKDNKNLYAVKCTKKQLSKISNQKVSPKSDIYIVSIEQKIPLNDSYIDEDFIYKNNIAFKIVPNSGISVKEENSKSYTIQKMTVETFYKIFDNYELGCAIEYYTTEKDFHKNKDIESAWNTTSTQVISKITSLAKEYSYTKNIKLDSYQNIKRTAIGITKHIIDNNQKISDFIFKGIGAFDDPYYAIYLYKEGNIFINSTQTKYQITTGSGRSKGDYTIVIKP
jgi:predicted RNase H-related nuclease YkuK (DUF458 family)